MWFQDHSEEGLTSGVLEPALRGTGAGEVERYMRTSPWKTAEAVCMAGDGWGHTATGHGLGGWQPGRRDQGVTSC